METKYIEKVKEINKGKNLKYYILTMGCQLNENDSEKLCGMVEEMGYQPTEEYKEADLVIFNTCCVRENAEDKLFGKLGELKKVKETRGTIIAIGGCMMQEKHITDKIHESYSYTDIIFGTHTLQNFPEDLYKTLETKKKQQDILDIDGEVYEGLPIKRTSNIKASVTIMYGCNNFCTYCIVPYVRGRERSRHPKDILAEVKELAKEGYKEITLLGQNVNSYLRAEKWKEEGKEYEGINSFATLLRAINKIEGIERIRFVSPHPKDFTDDVIEAIADCEKVCKLVHLPLQSGSSNVLKLMNRKYTKEQYLELVEKMKKRIPNLTLSTDIIVGFAGETEEDFEETLDLVQECKYDNAYTFIYSPRVGTPASKLPDNTSKEEKEQRLYKLNSIVNKYFKENNEKLVGKTVPVLVEGISDKKNEYFGYSDTNKLINFTGEDVELGSIVNVLITDAKTWSLDGKVSK